MITNTGKNILGKYLIGQAPSYASYIAIGCGPQPKASDHVFSPSEREDYQNRTSLEFEMDRWQITSRGYITENQIITVDGVEVVVPVSKIVFTTEIPSDPRYEITEVGVFSAGANPAAGAFDSKMLYSFTTSETWEYHNSEGKEDIPLIETPLDYNSDTDNKDNVILGEYNISSETVPQFCPVFRAYADDRAFNDEERLARYERPRFLNDAMMIVGNLSNLSIGSDGRIVVNETNPGGHIHNIDPSFNLTKNSPLDEIKLAFSVVNKNPTNDEFPDQVILMVEFSNSDTQGQGEWSRMEIIMNNGTDPGEYDFTQNRYFSISKKLSELHSSIGANWGDVSIVKIYGCTKKAGLLSDNFYISLDAMRLENVTSFNPLYGLSGYSVISNVGSQPITKEKGTTSYLEFRFAVDVV